MNCVNLPEDCSQQWELLLLLLSSEEKKIDRTGDSEVEVMTYFYKNEGVRKILEQWLRQMHSSYVKKKDTTDTATKSDEVALYWRQKGNESFRNNTIEESYKCYTKSVLYAEPSGPMYPLALANRSASLLRLKRFQDCLLDISLALENRYPEEQRHKLYLRQADCHIELKQSTRAQEALQRARQHAHTQQLSATHASEFERHLKILDKKLETLGGCDVTLEQPQPPICLQDNPHTVHAACNIQLRRSDTAGRYVVTTEEIQRGDVIFSEEPYAFVALPIDGDLAIVCEQCCRRDLNPVPCNSCARAVYCSEACRGAAWLAHHRWECVGAQCRLFPTIGIAHLALRVLLVTTSSGFPPLPQRPASSRPLDAAEVFQMYTDVDNVAIYNKDMPAFYRMFHLVTNFDKMNNADYVQYALTATMLTLYLEMFTSFFSHLPLHLPFTLSSGSRRLLAAALILRSLGQLVCNGHAALSLDTREHEGDGRTVTEREVRLATAIYPSAAMMNHSCDPNIINTFYRNRLIVRCGRPLEAGAEVLNCYGPHRAREPAADRRAQLRAQYLFNCNCAACVDTERRDAVLVFSAYACHSCKGPVLLSVTRAQCQQCRKCDLDVDRAAALAHKADELQLRAEHASTIEERCEKMQASLKLKQQVLHRHHTSLRLTADRLARIYAEMGEFSKSVELIKQNVQSLEYQYGSISVEVAHELRKLVDVMLERMFHSPHHTDYRDWCLETHKIIKKAYQLMELNYGAWEPLVERLKGQERSVAALLADRRAPDAVDCVHHNLHYNLKI